ncbi:uncharacterized protein PV07_04801 [Cladophialophora immunda]|uniref:Uncharacterized protein n=1 Tax=Cladophialophora immunda TaxID=569365 RepID=A0A0D2CFF8_9EURO|nr:uncharacterized protein PV07_04801 [Cladophialophora immunda]KIW28950.1 hypothetical protein PV07_04801 [Cladophialophora immunda]
MSAIERRSYRGRANPCTLQRFILLLYKDKAFIRSAGNPLIQHHGPTKRRHRNHHHHPLCRPRYRRIFNLRLPKQGFITCKKRKTNRVWRRRLRLSTACQTSTRAVGTCTT